MNLQRRENHSPVMAPPRPPEAPPAPPKDPKPDEK